MGEAKISPRPSGPHRTPPGHHQPPTGQGFQEPRPPRSRCPRLAGWQVQSHGDGTAQSAAAMTGVIKSQNSITELKTHRGLMIVAPGCLQSPFSSLKPLNSPGKSHSLEVRRPGLVPGHQLPPGGLCPLSPAATHTSGLSQGAGRAWRWPLSSDKVYNSECRAARGGAARGLARRWRARVGRDQGGIGAARSGGGRCPTGTDRTGGGAPALPRESLTL